MGVFTFILHLSLVLFVGDSNAVGFLHHLKTEVKLGQNPKELSFISLSITALPALSHLAGNIHFQTLVSC